MSRAKVVEQHLFDKYLRVDRLPHIWCPGCGIGILLSCFIKAIDTLQLDLDKLVVVSGIGCAGRIAGYIKVDSFHTLHGRAIPFAVGLKLANPSLNVVVISGDGDIFSIGGNHFIHAARRNNDIMVICVNNFIYGMTGGQYGPTTPYQARTSTSPYGNVEHAFNLPHVAASCGAVYVARWTVLHTRRLTESIIEALQKKGFRFIEVLSPCPTVYGRRNNMPRGLDMMKFFMKNCEIRNFEDTKNIAIEPGEKIIIGKFVDIEKKAFEDAYYELIRSVRGY
ncbi:2-oxoacid:ferredoxin oxidoreductase subunit beta [archaeon]|nr:MAG: 2-oxoacid:ferredoxin oxidoreductase subunit beta [archaeon]